MFAEIPESEEISDEGSRQLEDEYEKIERYHNSRSEANRMFRIQDEMLLDNGKVGTSIYTSMNINTDPAEINLDCDVMLIQYLVKGKQVRAIVRIVENVEVDSIFDMQFKMPRKARTTVTPTVDEPMISIDPIKKQ